MLAITTVIFSLAAYNGPLLTQKVRDKWDVKRKPQKLLQAAGVFVDLL